jgi:hypothetical protein
MPSVGTTSALSTAADPGGVSGDGLGGGSGSDPEFMSS